jgi:hypothetical protein
LIPQLDNHAIRSPAELLRIFYSATQMRRSWFVPLMFC